MILYALASLAAPTVSREGRVESVLADSTPTANVMVVAPAEQECDPVGARHVAAEAP